MKSLIIPVHSVIDVITNSSSEIFVAAKKSTITAIKKLIDNLIQAAQHEPDVLPFTADDLFSFEIVYSCNNEDFDEVFLTEREVKEKRKEIKDLREKLEKELDSTPGEQTAKREEITGNLEDLETWTFADGENGEYVQSQIRVTVKDKTNKSAVSAAKVLADLTALFDIEATYN